MLHRLLETTPLITSYIKVRRRTEGGALLKSYSVPALIEIVKSNGRHAEQPSAVLCAEATV